MMNLFRRVVSIWRTDSQVEDAVHRIEDVQQRHEDIQHDLHAVKKRTDTLHRLVSSMRGRENVY